MLLSSDLFSLVHANMSGFLIYLALGAILAWAYRRTGRLATAIVGHATLNTIVLIVSQFAPTDLNI